MRGWIFVIGCYNSGTTLLERLLRVHPQIAALPREGQFLTPALITPKSAGIPRLWAEKEGLFRFAPGEKSDLAVQVRRDWTAQLDPPGRPFALEKSPPNTARTLWLQQHFPEAYFIHIVRNGYAVALGIREKVRKQYGPGSDLLRRAAHQWVRSAEVVQQDRPHLARFLEIRYESLCADPRGVSTQIADFLGMPPLAKRVLRKTYLIHGVQSPLVDQNAARLAQMTEEQREVITREAHGMLEHYGYLR